MLRVRFPTATFLHQQEEVFKSLERLGRILSELSDNKVSLIEKAGEFIETFDGLYINFLSFTQLAVNDMKAVHQYAFKRAYLEGVLLTCKEHQIAVTICNKDCNQICDSCLPIVSLCEELGVAIEK